MNSIDSLAGIAVGGFLMTVAVKGKSGDMLELMKRDKGFIKWAFAVSVLGYLYTIKSLHESVGMLIALGFIGLFLLKGNEISKGAQNLWSILGE
jgi:hypothetical protein